MLPVPGSRVVTVSSVGHRIGPRSTSTTCTSNARTAGSPPTGGQAGQPDVHVRDATPARRAAPPSRWPRMSSTELARNTPAALRLRLTWLAPLITQTPAMGALPTLRAATGPAVLGGQYSPGPRTVQVKGHPGWSPPARSRTGGRPAAALVRLREPDRGAVPGPAGSVGYGEGPSGVQ
ncbi:hypothetical protein V2I01_43330 [Micromonospora sp. BRA006-A]|nr:hypothetical protein [Micromonospora sp. BRA006-A]